MLIFKKHVFNGSAQERTAIETSLKKNPEKSVPIGVHMEKKLKLKKTYRKNVLT